MKKQRGQVLVIFAGGLVALMAIAAVVVDIGFVFIIHRHEQRVNGPAHKTGHIPGCRRAAGAAKLAAQPALGAALADYLRMMLQIAPPPVPSP